MDTPSEEYSPSWGVAPASMGGGVLLRCRRAACFGIPCRLDSLGIGIQIDRTGASRLPSSRAGGWWAPGACHSGSVARRGRLEGSLQLRKFSFEGTDRGRELTDLGLVLIRMVPEDAQLLVLLVKGTLRPVFASAKSCCMSRIRSSARASLRSAESARVLCSFVASATAASEAAFRVDRQLSRVAACCSSLASSSRAAMLGAGLRPATAEGAAVRALPCSSATTGRFESGAPG